MMYLLDANIFLEVLLEQQHADPAARLLQTLDTFYLTDFAFHSVGVVIQRNGDLGVFTEFCADLRRRSVSLLQVSMDEMTKLVQYARQFRLDFDDAYQYTAAAQFSLEIVSFDADFDRTDRGRLTPTDVLRREGA